MAGSELEKAVKALMEKESGWKGFQPKEQAPIRDSAGKAPNGVATPGGSSGGDLTEQNFGDRTYFSRRTLRSTDGLITWLYDPIKSVKMTDASGKTVVLTFAEPTT